MIIYKTTNLVNGKIYIGQDSKDDPKYLGSGLLLTKAINKYGKENFKKEILQKCENKKELNESEKYWIGFYKSTDKNIGYNIAEGGTGGKLIEVEVKKGKTYEEYYGVDKAREIKQKFSEKRKGKKLTYKNITSEEVGEKISKALKAKNIIRSEEQKEKISESLKKHFNSETGQKQKEALKQIKLGKKQTQESNKKRSEALKGKRPKILEVHPNAKIWFFYDKDNNLVFKTIGNRTVVLKELKTNQRRIEIFYDLDECLNHKLNEKKDFKIYGEKYYKK